MNNMNRKNILIFAGTYEGRMLCEYLNEEKTQVTCCVATKYGNDSIASLKNIEVICGRLSKDEIVKIIKKRKIDVVIDATHPYAVMVTQNIKMACSETRTNYLRLLRKEEEYNNVKILSSIEQVIAYLQENEGNVLLTTGSKELSLYTSLKDFQERLIIRVLPSSEVLFECEKMGFLGKNIIAMQGPFSKQLNIDFLKQFNCKYLITKNTGKVGGLIEKIQAAKKANVQVVMIKRPVSEEGLSIEEVLEFLKN